MDTVEERNGTYFYKGVSNISAGELFFWILLDVELPFRLPTFTNASLRYLKPMWVNNLGKFVGRAVPVLGWVLLASDVATIVYKATSHYNRIARGNDKIW
ncbi:hypothetical protein F3J29_15760 [Enterobacter sp. Cy-643]|uniref:hypothetical protein n=1 Tax=Enterobacter sp. Cy-643 TaxID=2608346 RepID=UPI00141E2FEC|nr:hypothetical protein [Enterobacter sp. Cy-643]NIF33583.1 hypothetical protein [Enterobacter sp. Cy-643]